mgnify:CR=1 FL=1
MVIIFPSKEYRKSPELDVVIMMSFPSEITFSIIGLSISVTLKLIVTTLKTVFYSKKSNKIPHKMYSFVP